ncbi:hypothetical protein [Agrococcus citreus]|uniref:Uncharacterized protein n=1 Tax=Agrococcus citreus TaxID=84643 RepID=A0ABP4JF95_9MICO
MLDPHALHEQFHLALTGTHPDASATYRSALAAVTMLVGDDEIEGRSAWLDYGHVGTGASARESEIAVHLRVLTRSGIIRLDQDFDFNGAPDAHLIPWSQVIRLHVIAKNESAEPTPVNVWVETSTAGRVEFHGTPVPRALTAIIESVRRNTR